ncbi:hypothetical protein KAI32_04285 [Candidatus Pacearchaeota archaeon]|nr:hypothetical protein [Candidatus Pacearchaeota archaeon]
MRKIQIFTGIFLILIFITSSVYFLKTNDNPEFSITLKGCVNPSPDNREILNDSIIYIGQNRFTYKYRDTTDINDGLRLGETYVKKGLEGCSDYGYSTSILIPWEMELVIFAKHDFPEIIWVDKNTEEISLNLTYGVSDSEDNTLKGTTYGEREELDKLESFFSERKFELSSLTLRNQVEKEYITEAKEYIKESNEGKTIEEKLSKLYMAHWFYYKALLSIEYYSLYECAQNNEKLLSGYNFRYHINPFYKSDIINTSNGIFSSLDPHGHRYQRDDIESVKNNLTLMVDEISYIKRQHKDLYNRMEECRGTNNLLKRDFKSQDYIFKYKLIFLGLVILLSLIGGMFLEYRYKPSKNIFSKIYNKTKAKYSSIEKKFGKNITTDVSALNNTVYIPLGILAFTGYIFISNMASEIFRANCSIALLFTVASLLALSISNFIKNKASDYSKIAGHFYISTLILSLISIFLGQVIITLIGSIFNYVGEIIKFVWQVLFSNLLP